MTRLPSWLPLLLASAAACHQPHPRPEMRVSGGSAAQGRDLVTQFGCGACHRIPGVAGARGMVGPPLTDFAQRGYIAGRLPNQGENLVRWIQNPRAVDPETAMPVLGLTDSQARHIAAYLYTLHRGGSGPPRLFPESWLKRLSELGRF